LAGQHQRFNAAIAVATVQALQDQIPVSPDAIRQGLTTVQWAGRMQILPPDSGNRIFVLDGAHNPDGAGALRVAFEELFPGARPALLLGVLQDKDSTAIVGTLAPMACRIVLAPVSSARSLDPAALRADCIAACPGTRVEVCSSVAEALQATARDPLVLVTGSLYLVGEVMERLGISPARAAEERALNEWTLKS
jgi:dihydrofolate synthase/folylpolyglutamate synthase